MAMTTISILPKRGLMARLGLTADRTTTQPVIPVRKSGRQ